MRTKRPTITRYRGKDAGMLRQRDQLNTDLDCARRTLTHLELDASRYNEAATAILDGHPQSDRLLGYWRMEGGGR